MTFANLTAESVEITLTDIYNNAYWTNPVK